jgi:hypothetical protein
MPWVSLCALDHMHYACGLHFFKHLTLFFKLYLLLVTSNSKLYVSQEEIRLKSRLAMFFVFFFQFEFINNIWHFSNISFSFNNITFLFYWQFWLFDLLPPASEKTTVEGEERICGPDLQTYGCLPPIRVLILLTSTLLFVWTKRNTCQLSRVSHWNYPTVKSAL